MKHALDHLDSILRGRKPALFLDFDGTLVDIAPRPDLARLPDSVRRLLAELAQGGTPISLVSGRDLEDLRRRIDLPQVGYAGSHGFDLLGPPPARTRHEPGAAFLPALDAVERDLRARLAAVPGVFIERKRYAFAVHWRQVAPDAVPAVTQTARTIAAGYAGVQVREGKMVLEMVPDLAWDKGTAVLWLLEQLPDNFLPVYLGDDVTDEDAFRALQGRGAGIVVQEQPAPSAAGYRLANPAEVALFLGQLAQRL